MQENDLDVAVLDAPPASGRNTPTVSVTPLSYTQLRLLAEYTAVLEEDVNFVLTPEGTLIATRAPTDDELLIPAKGSGKFPWITVELYADGVDPLTLQPRCADALFWSDAAVQKFLVPYVASCAGDGAALALARLRRAWDEFDGERVQVYALAHVVDYSDGAPLSLEHAIQVVYARVSPPQGNGPPPELLLAPLDTFLNEYCPPPGEACGLGGHDRAAPRRVDYRRGSDPSRFQRPDYRPLRAAAEYADSLCKKPMYFTFREQETGFRHEQELPELGAGDFTIPVLTPTIGNARSTLSRVTWKLLGEPAQTVESGVDAMFWSDAAVAQFMYPYYASKGGLHEGTAELYWLYRMWTGGFPDLRPVTSCILPPDPACHRRVQKDGVIEREVVGLVHFPTSEWMPEKQGATAASVLREVGMLVGGRTVRPEFLSEG